MWWKSKNSTGRRGRSSGHLFLSSEKKAAPAHGSYLAPPKSLDTAIWYPNRASNHSGPYDFTSPILDIESNSTDYNRRQQAFPVKDERADTFRFAGFLYSYTALPSWDNSSHRQHKVVRTAVVPYFTYGYWNLNFLYFHMLWHIILLLTFSSHSKI